MNNKGFTIIELLLSAVLVIIIPALLYGWVQNIIKLYHSSFNPLTGQVVLRAIGVFLAPVGAIMGYL